MLGGSWGDIVERVAVFVDGSNFYRRLKELGVQNTTQFDYRGLAQWLARHREVVYRGYYIGVVRAEPGNPKSETIDLIVIYDILLPQH